MSGRVWSGETAESAHVGTMEKTPATSIVDALNLLDVSRDKLLKVVDRLAGALTAHAERLAPILRPSTPEEPSLVDEEEGALGHSNLANEICARAIALDAARYAIARMATGVEQLTERVDL